MARIIGYLVLFAILGVLYLSTESDSRPFHPVPQQTGSTDADFKNLKIN